MQRAHLFTYAVANVLKIVPTQSSTTSIGMSDMASAQPLLPHDSDASSSEQISTDKAEQLTQKKSLDTSGKGQLTQFLQPPCSGLNLKSALKIALVVVLAAVASFV